MHHDTCVSHVPWCMSGSLTRGGWENVPGIPNACVTHNHTYLARGPLTNQGVFCPADGRRAHNLLSYQCRFKCIHSSHCAAINYNTTNGICNLIASPCPVALSDPALEFVLFLPSVANSQCHEWRPIERSSWDRAVKVKDTQYVVRILRSGSHYVGKWSQQMPC